jgi:hypothetical protein
MNIHGMEYENTPPITTTQMTKNATGFLAMERPISSISSVVKQVPIKEIHVISLNGFGGKKHYR